MATTYQIFADFPDHRVTGRCIYSISDLLTISLLTSGQPHQILAPLSSSRR